jgi:hypothetical protein
VALGETHQAETGELWKNAIPDPGKNPAADPHEIALLSRLGLFAFDDLGACSPGDRGVASSLSPTIATKLQAGGYEATKEQVSAEFLEPKQGKKDKASTPEAAAPTLPEPRWILVGLRAACDEARQRGTLRRVALALEVPDPLPSSLKVREHGAKSETPTFQAGTLKASNHRRLIFNWHWVLVVTREELAGATVFYRLREPLMNMVGSHFGGHAMRPGIIEHRAE